MEKQNRLPLFSAFGKTAALYAVLVVLVAVLGAINYLNIENQRDVSSIETLSGQRIGCCVGWETDYLLTPRDDITLLRYNTNAECIMALNYGQVDAVGIDAISVMNVMQLTEGLEIVPEPITYVGCTLYASHKAEPIMKEFDSFVTAFLETDEYKEYKERTLQQNGRKYKVADIPVVENGKKLVVGYLPDCYPESYYDFEKQRPAGYGVEILQRFAYEYGYTIEYVETSDTASAVLLQQNKLDFSANYISDVYREETEMNGNCLMTAPYLMTDVVLVKVKPGEKMVLNGEIDT